MDSQIPLLRWLKTFVKEINFGNVCEEFVWGASQNKRDPLGRTMMQIKCAVLFTFRKHPLVDVIQSVSVVINKNKSGLIASNNGFLRGKK